MGGMFSSSNESKSKTIATCESMKFKAALSASKDAGFIRRALVEKLYDNSDQFISCKFVADVLHDQKPLGETMHDSHQTFLGSKFS